MSLEELEDKPDAKAKRYIGMKSVMDVGMGIIYIGVGALILFAGEINFHNEFVDSTIGKIFAGLVILYGGWRVYRGIKKDYFVER
jgi:hypothetical protein